MDTESRGENPKQSHKVATREVKMMTEKSEAMLELVVDNVAATTGSTRRSEQMTLRGLARLLVALVESCGGSEDCSTCILCGVGCCPYDRGFDPVTLLPLSTR